MHPELFYDAGYPDSIRVGLWILPFSRGTVKITSADAFVKPEVNVNYFAPFGDHGEHIESGYSRWRNMSLSLCYGPFQMGFDLPIIIRHLVYFPLQYQILFLVLERLFELIGFGF